MKKILLITFSLMCGNILTSKTPSASIEVATVVYKKTGCDYIVLQGNQGYIIAELMGGTEPDQDDEIVGNFHYGTKDFYNGTKESCCRLYIDDYMLSKDAATNKIVEKCKQ